MHIINFLEIIEPTLKLFFSPYNISKKLQENIIILSKVEATQKYPVKNWR